MRSKIRNSTDEKFMRRALELAKRGLGKTWPNPAVGAVIVKNGKIVGEGYHRKAGTPHAEIHALRQAGQQTKGATLFITLEPCVHHGKTPPCTEAIKAHGIKRVVIGVCDPNPKVFGKGIKRLRAAGINVHVGMLQEECRELIRHFEYWIKTGRPRVTCKAALSLDGKIATARGESKWITGEACRRAMHVRRDQHDAIVIGRTTAELDDPRLTIRHGNREKIKPVVLLDSSLRLPTTLRLFSREPHQLFIATTKKAPRSRFEWARKKGFHVFLCRTSKGKILLVDLLQQLGAHGITSLFVEGGGEIFSSFLNEKLIDHFILCYAPKFLGGNARSLLPRFLLSKLVNAPRLKNIERRVYGDDLVIEGDYVYGNN